ncbi:MAG: hypothetical protein IKQ69_01330 [Oscillospiraceae bacterium]|nr:hypothetical protein [Oscillospiraceae bacterium]
MEKRSRPLFPLIFLVFPISQLFLLFPRFYGASDSPNSGGTLVTVLLLIMCVAADSLLAVATRSLRKTAALQAEKESLLRQIRQQEEYCRSLAEHYARMSTLRHDLSNHLYTVKILAEEERTDEARRYIEELRRSFELPESYAAQTACSGDGGEI